MPRYTVRLTAEDDARLRAAAALRGLTAADVLRAGVRAVVAAELARAAGAPAAVPGDGGGAGADARRGEDRRRRREAYTSGALEAWAAAIEEQGERRAAHWPERRGAADRERLEDRP